MRYGELLEPGSEFPTVGILRMGVGPVDLDGNVEVPLGLRKMVLSHR